MDKSIVKNSSNQFQLIMLAIQLTHKVLSLADCMPDLNSNTHAEKAFKIAQQWNEKFIETYTHGEE